MGEVYPGIELNLQAYGGTIEKIFKLAPGADPTNIRMKLRGLNSLSLSQEGALVVQTIKGPVRYSAPLAYQEIKGERRPVAVAYYPL